MGLGHTRKWVSSLVPHPPFSRCPPPRAATPKFPNGRPPQVSLARRGSVRRQTFYASERTALHLVVVSQERGSTLRMVVAGADEIALRSSVPDAARPPAGSIEVLAAICLETGRRGRRRRLGQDAATEPRSARRAISRPLERIVN
jgi:hypothetical protein